MLEQIIDKEEKMSISRYILESLKDWFAIDEAREQYISESTNQIFISYKENNENIGFVTLKETGNATVELAVMGVLKNHHRKGIGRKLVQKAIDTARSQGYSFMQVKTVAMGKYADYDCTNLFYIDCGFKEFELIPELWGEDDPCQIYITAL